MANIVVRLIGNFFDLGGMVTEVALRDPISALLVVTCVLLWTFAFGLGGYMTVGAVLSWFGGRLPTNGGQPPQGS